MDADTEPPVYNIPAFSLKVTGFRRMNLHRRVGPVKMMVHLKMDQEQAQRFRDFLDEELKKSPHNLISVSISGVRQDS